MAHIVKRKGHKEKFDERKIYASCYQACLSCHTPHEKAEMICEKVTKELSAWVKTKKDVNAHMIFMELARRLKKHSKNAAFMYETHRDLS